MKSFLCDFHVHSCLSPCAELTMTPREIASVCVQRGIDWISIADHNSAGNVRVFSRVLGESGIAVIPAIEVHTLEDVHVLAYFPSVELAEEYSNWLKREKLPRLEVDPEISGYQLYVDETDSFTGMESVWLGQPTLLDIDRVLESVQGYGGLCVMAHIDRKMGLIAQLGFIPAEYAALPMEISFEKTLKIGTPGANLIHSSDAHSLNLVRPTLSLLANNRNFGEFKEALASEGKRVKIIWD